MSFHSTSLLRGQNAPFVQSHGFGAALTHLGHPPLRLPLSRGRGEVQVLRRRFGPLRLGLISRIDVPRDDLARLAREAECNAFVLNCETAAGAHGVMLQTPGTVAELNISRDPDDLRAGLQQKWRNRLNRAERSGLRVTEAALPVKGAHWLLEMEAAQARRQRYSNWSADVTMAFARANKAQARLFEARQNGDIVAAMLFLCHGAVASYHIGWSGPQGRATCAHQAIMWEAMIRLRMRGMERLDLGLVATDRAPGLARFKLGTGASPKRLGGTWLVVPAWLRNGKMRF